MRHIQKMPKIANTTAPPTSLRPNGSVQRTLINPCLTNFIDSATQIRSLVRLQAERALRWTTHGSAEQRAARMMALCCRAFPEVTGFR